MNYISQRDFITFFKDYLVNDCSVINNKNFIFSMKYIKDCNDEYEAFSEYPIRKRMVVYTYDRKDSSHGMAIDFKDCDRVFTISAQNKGYFITEYGAVISIDAKGFHHEHIVQKNFKQNIKENINIFKLKNISNTIYGCGAFYLAFRQTYENSWEYIGNFENYIDYAENNILNIGFIDIDGFSHDDLYAIGQRGSVFHYNGESWKNIDFPSNYILESICCAGDGNVYIGAQYGSIFKGRNSKWKLIHNGNMTLSYTDIIYYDDIIWCTNDYGLWIIKDNILMKAPVSDDISICSGHLSCGENTLLLGGLWGTACYNGDKWDVLYKNIVDEYIINEQ